MAGSVLEPKEILEYSAHKGTAKAENRADRLAVLGFLGGAFISVGYAIAAVYSFLLNRWLNFQAHGHVVQQGA
ncbi:MAG: hypothetical protein ACFNT5_05395, partial [Cardiobacterium hominis]